MFPVGDTISCICYWGICYSSSSSSGCQSRLVASPTLNPLGRHPRRIVCTYLFSQKNVYHWGSFSRREISYISCFSTNSTWRQNCHPIDNWQNKSPKHPKKMFTSHARIIHPVWTEREKRKGPRWELLFQICFAVNDRLKTGWKPFGKYIGHFFKVCLWRRMGWN